MGNFSFGLGLSTNINPTQATREKIQNYFKEEYDKRKATDPYFRPVYPIKNTFGIKNNTENRNEFVLTNVWDLATTSAAQRWTQSLTTDQGSSISAITTSNKLKHIVGLYAEGMKPEAQLFKDLKYVLLLPEGVEAENIAPDPAKVAVTATLERVVKNYKDTGRNAHIYSIEGFTVPASTEQHPHIAHEMAMIADLKVTPATKKGSNVITGFYTWSNTELNEIFVNNHETDNLDVDDDGSKTERVVMSNQGFNFIEPREFSIIKHSKFSSEVDEKYSLTANVDTAKPTDYRITINNNTNSSRDNIDVIDILPRIGDKEIVKDAHGAYLDRGSQFKMQLTGPIAPVTGYKYLYSTTTPYESLADNINLANWVDETGIADFKQVTMFRIQLDAGQTMAPFTTKEFKFTAIPNDLPTAFAGKEAINSIAAILGGDIDAAIESVTNAVSLATYKLRGTVFTDRNDDSTFDAAKELKVANRNVKIYHTPQGGAEQLVTTLQTKPDGSYEFNPHQFGLGRGNYRVEVEKTVDEVFAATVNSVQPNINSDVDANGSKAVVLSPEHADVVVNAAFVHPKTEVRHEFSVSATSENSTLLAGLNARLAGKNYGALIGDTIKPKNDIDLSDEVINDGVNSGTWSFVSWNPVSKTAAQAIEVFKGEWTFTKKRGNVDFEFVSETVGKVLPTAVTDLKPNTLINQVYGTTVTPAPTTFNDVVINDGVDSGTWSFVAWDKANEIVDGSNDKFTGTWKFTKKQGNVEFEFVSDSAKPLPTEVSDLKPNVLVNQVYGTTVTPAPTTFNDVVINDGVNSGTWSFVAWDKANEIVDGSNDKFTGTWTFIKKQGNVEFEFVSDSAKPLPNEVITLKPTTILNQEYGTDVVVTPLTFEDVTLEEGTWKFVAWNKVVDTVDGEDKVIGTWTFIKKEIVPVSNLKNPVDSSDVTLNYILLLLVSIGLFVVVKKENK